MRLLRPQAVPGRHQVRQRLGLCVPARARPLRLSHSAPFAVPTFWGTAGPDAVEVRQVRGWWPFTKPGHLQLLCGHCGSLLGSALRYGGVPPSWRRFTAASACLAYRHEMEHGHQRLREAFDPLASGEGRWYAAKLGPKGQRQTIAQRAQAGAQSVLGGEVGLLAPRGLHDKENRGNVSERHRKRTHPLAKHMTETEFDLIMAGPLGWLLYFLSTAATVLGVGLFVVVFCIAPYHKEKRKAMQRAREKAKARAAKRPKPMLRLSVEDAAKDH